MNLSVYILILSIWTINSLNTNQSAVSSTTGAKHLETMETKMESFRRRLLIIIIGIMIIAFVFTCFCFLHYCISDDVPKAGMVAKEGIAAKPSWSSKILLMESKTTNLCSLEKQSLLSSTDKLSGPLSPEKSSLLSSAEKLIRPSSAERLSTRSSAEKLIETLSPEKSLIPNSEENSIRPLSPEKSSLPSSAGNLLRLSHSKKSTKSSRPKRFLKSSHREKSYMSHSLEKSYKLTHIHKPLSQVSSSYPEKSLSLPWPAKLQSPNRPAKQHRLTRLQNQYLSSKPYSLKKSVKTPRHRHLKRSVSIGKAVILSKPLITKTCQWYNERCLVCQTSDTFVNVSEAKKKNTRNLPSSSKKKSFPRSFYMANSKDNEYYNVNDSDKTYDSNDDDSDKEIIIICNIRCNDFIPNETSHN